MCKAHIRGCARTYLAICEWLFLFRDDFCLFGLLGVQFDIALPLFRYIIFVIDRFNGAFRNTRLAVNALFWMDVEHRFPLVKTFDGANNNTVSVFAVVTRLSYYVRHRRASISEKLGNRRPVRNQPLLQKDRANIGYRHLS